MSGKSSSIAGTQYMLRGIEVFSVHDSFPAVQQNKQRLLSVFKFVFFDEDSSYFSQLSDYFDHEAKVGTMYHYSDFNLLLNTLLDQKMSPDAVFLALRPESKAETLQRAEQIYHTNRFVPVIYVSDRINIWDETILLPMTNLVGYITLPINKKVIQEYLEKLRIET